MVGVPKNYEIRLRCPHGDEDRWLRLERRTESLEQLLSMSWDFECSMHGVQRELPVEGREQSLKGSQATRLGRLSNASNRRSSRRMAARVPVRVYGWIRSQGSFHEEASTILVNDSGALLSLAAAVEIGETFFVVNKSTRVEQECRVVYVEPGPRGKSEVGIAFKMPVPGFWKVVPAKPRVTRTIKVRIKGVDHQGQPYSQSAYTVNVSATGARLDGPGYIAAPGDIIDVRCGWRRGRFRVVWTGEPGTPESGHMGIACLEANKNIWGIALPGGDTAARGSVLPFLH